MSMLEPATIDEYSRRAFFRNTDLVAAVKDIKETLEKHDMTVFSRYSEHYDEEKMEAEQTLTPEFSGCGTTFDLEELRLFLEEV